MANKKDRELVVLILCEACFASDEVVAEKFGVSRQSISNWRKELTTDHELRQNFTHKKKQVMDSCYDELSEAIVAGGRFVTNAARTAQKENFMDAGLIHAIVGAIKICGEVQSTARALNVGQPNQNSTNEKSLGENQADITTTNGYTN